jgi:hypothetical protein
MTEPIPVESIFAGAEPEPQPTDDTSDDSDTDWSDD